MLKYCNYLNGIEVVRRFWIPVIYGTGQPDEPAYYHHYVKLNYKFSVVQRAIANCV